ncbi:3646_t:CDS:2 [Dentiscutata erythropus]|uniref:3646_t:CDS:1 n=1 Tax=Dentiscutata erythropus TaxID=1348616 RepID=A0A9N9NLT4_9GLOM|nr:3646_t:CDS:2 [Dentiscutata erythropus]
MHLLFYTLFLLFAAVASAFPNGAGTCLSNQTIIEGVPNSPMGKLNASLGYDFKVRMKNNNYVPKGPPVCFEITGNKPFKGLLLYALDSNKNHVGQWVLRRGFQFKENCTGDPKGTLTHSCPAKKRPGIKFKWRPPQMDVGPITFVGTIVVSTEEGFQIVKTNQSFTACGSNSTIVPTQPSATPSSNPYGQSSSPYDQSSYPYDSSSSSSYPSSATSSSNSVSTPLNDESSQTAAPKSSSTSTIVKSLWVQSCLIASLTAWYLSSAIF